jgi:hypothetical protein
VSIIWNKKEEILDRCTDAIQQQGCTVEECLALYPAQQVEFEPLLRLVAHLNAARTLQASPQFQSAAPLRLQMHASDKLKLRRDGSQPPSFLPGLGIPGKARQGWLETGAPPNKLRLVPLLAGLLLILLVVSGMGTAAASAQALPGDFLYPIKRAQENIQLTVTLDESSQARLRLEFAGRRIDEAETLLKQNRSSGIDQALLDYNNQIQSELKFLDQESGLSLTQRSELANMLVSDLSDHETRLKSIMTEAPESSKTNIETALAASQNAHNQALQTIRRQHEIGGTLTPTPTPATPSATPHPTKALTFTPVPPESSTLPSRQPGVINILNLTRTPRLTYFPSAVPPTNRASPVPGSVLTPRPKPTYPIISTLRATRTPVPPWPIAHPTATSSISSNRQSTPTKPPAP